MTPRAQHIYNEDADAKKDIQGALALAQATNKNVLLDFGANWCPDCQVLDIYMHDDVNSPLIDKYYIVVHVDVGRMDKNLDVAFTFNVPINKAFLRWPWCSRRAASSTRRRTASLRICAP